VARKKKLPLLEDILITDIAAEGNSIAKIDDMVTFIPGLIPGDVVDVQITRKRRNYMEGFAVQLKKESKFRIEPFCPHFGICGGCRWQNLPYEKQLYYKQKQVSDALERIAKADFPEILPILGSERQQYYRNKLEFTFSNSRWLSNDEIKSEAEINDRRALGFHIPGKFDRVLDIDQCYLQDERANSIRNEVRRFTLEHSYTYYHHRENQGLMRNLIIRNTELGEWMVIVVFEQDDKQKIGALLEHVHQTFPFITSLLYVINPKVNDTILDLEITLYAGRDHIFEQLNGLRFKIGPKSFFQTNTTQTVKLYSTVLQFASLTGNEIVYDLYTGTGTIANFIAGNCNKVVGIESVEEAINDAAINSTLNNIRNTTFIAGDIKDTLTQELLNLHGKPDVIITDPPRAGMHKTVIQSILETLPERIVYVSCNPATQARDINLLGTHYKVMAVQPVDMFPHTYHVENVVQMARTV
jgi:23S rRNA (uracil1939-C5)-methyltransferase